MPKNFFRKLIESSSIDKFFNSSDEREDKSHDFERAKDVLFSSKNLNQLGSAVKYINNFNKKHKIRENSPEFIYFDKMINVMKIKLRTKRKEVGNDSEESERMTINLENIIKESLGEMEWMKKTNVDLIKLGSVFIDNEDERFVIDSISPYGLTIKSLDFPKDKEDTTIRKNWRKEDWLKLIDDGDIRWSHNKDLNESEELDWIKDIEPTNFDFSFDGEEYWVDVSKIDREGRRKIVNYIKKTVPDYEEFEDDLFGHISRGNYKGIVIHCGSDRTDFEPEENLLCSANSSYEYDYEVENPYSDISKSIYIDGQEILDYLTVIGDEEELDESLEWSDKDAPFDEKDKSFESDPSWKNDEDWSLNPERSYWKQGDAGGSGGGDMNESDDLQWIKDVEPIKLLVWTDRKKKKKEINLDAGQLQMAVSSGHDNDFNWNIIDIERRLNNGQREGETRIDRYQGGGSDIVYWALNESDELQWIKDIKPSWLKVGQKFTSSHNLEISRRYEPKDKVQVGPMTFEIYDINHKNGEPHLRFAHNDVMGERNWESKKEKEISQNYGGTKFTQAKHNIDTGFWIPLTDCEFIESTHPNLVGKTKSDGSPYGHIYCRPSVKDFIKESEEFNWIKNVKPDPLIASPDVFFRSDDDMFYTLDQLGHDTTNMEEMTMAELAINYGYRWSEEHEGWYHRDEVADFTKLNESDDFEWIKNVPDTIPPRERRNKIPLKDFLVDVMKGDLDLLHQLYSEYDIAATQEYMQTGNGGEAFTYEDWEEFGYDEWVGDGHWVDNHRWMEDPAIWQSEVRESMELTDGIWKMVEWDTLDYDLERGTHQDRMVFKRKSDGAYFALDFSGSHYDGIEDWDKELYQVFPKQITRFIYESNKKIMFEGDMSWIEDIEPHQNYKGHPQGIVLLHNHQEIDEFCDIIDNYNGGRTEGSNRACDDLHHGLENRKNELAEMSVEDDEDYGEAMLSVSFFVEKRRPNKLTIGYWPYDVSEDEMYISDWLDGDFTFNKEYQIYKNINQLKTIFKNYKNPVL